MLKVYDTTLLQLMDDFLICLFNFMSPQFFSFYVLCSLHSAGVQGRMQNYSEGEQLIKGDAPHAISLAAGTVDSAVIPPNRGSNRYNLISYNHGVKCEMRSSIYM